MKKHINVSTTTDAEAINTIIEYMVDNPDLWNDGVYLHIIKDGETIELTDSYHKATANYHIGDEDINEMIEAYAEEIGKDISDVATNWMNEHGNEFWNTNSEWLRMKAEKFWEWIKKDME